MNVNRVSQTKFKSTAYELRSCALQIKLQLALFNFLKFCYLNLATSNYAVLHKNNYIALQIFDVYDLTFYYANRSMISLQILW